MNPSSKIDAIIAAVYDAWNRHDMAAFAALFAPNADFVNVLGMQWRGRPEIQATHVTLHRTIFRNSTNRVLSHTVRFPNPATALVHINWEMTGGEGVPGWDVGAVRTGIMTLVLVEEDGQWLITAAHNTDTVAIPMPQ